MAKTTDRRPAAKPSKMREQTVFWVPGMTAPAGFVLVHNQIRHSAWTREGTNGFRAWFSPASDNYLVCDCGWRPELGKHHRVIRYFRRASDA
jgi:hypothetical protein